MPSLPQKFYSTDQIIRYSSNHTHFFSKESKRAFESRIGQNAYPTNNPFVTLFITSEKFVGSNGWSDGRKYSIRSYDCRDHNIKTVGQYKSYQTGKSANTQAKKLALQWEFNLEDIEEYALLLNSEYDRLKKRYLSRGDVGFTMYDIGATNDYIKLRQETKEEIEEKLKEYNANLAQENQFNIYFQKESAYYKKIYPE